jgi:hypothetical protein
MAGKNKLPKLRALSYKDIEEDTNALMPGGGAVGEEI